MKIMSKSEVVVGGITIDVKEVLESIRRSDSIQRYLAFLLNGIDQVDVSNPNNNYYQQGRASVLKELMRPVVVLKTPSRGKK